MPTSYRKPADMLRSLLLALALHTAAALYAQHTIEISYWAPKHNLTSKLVKKGMVLEKYDKDGLLVERQGSYSDLASLEKTVYTYNEKKQVIAETDILSNGEIKNKREYAYDDKGLLKTMTTKGRTKELTDLTFVEEYFYDEKNALIKTVTTSDRGNISYGWLYEYKYSPDSTKTMIRRNAERDKKYNRSISRYDKNGLLLDIRESYYKWIYEYSYGSNGDWTVRKVYQKISSTSPKYVGEFRKSRVDNSSPAIKPDQNAYETLNAAAISASVWLCFL